LLANIAPKLQLHVLDQMERPRFVVADTMDLWIETARADLDALLRRVDLLILNDSEAREMTKETRPDSGRTKNSRIWSALCCDQERRTWCAASLAKTNFQRGAYPLEDIHDPTGAGDTLPAVSPGYLAAHVQGKRDLRCNACARR
jgi:sugar/nucleoside kinase (ribokinase family)